MSAKIAAEPRLEWRDFAEFAPALLYELLRFRQAIFVVEQASPYADLDGLDQRALHLLMWRDDSLVGCLRLIPHHDQRRVAIGRVAVAEGERGHGLARLLMDAGLARCRRDFPGWTVELGAQAYLVPFYTGLGFAAVSAPYDDCGVPHVDMRLGR